MQPPRYPQIWQCVGMIVGVYGVGYLIASNAPYRHWPIVLVGLLGKILGPLGFLHAALQGELPWRWGVVVLGNDLIWWAPFAAILYYGFRFHQDRSNTASPEWREALATESHRGMSLGRLSRRPALVVFLRHAGCAFCREMLDSLARQRKQIEAAGAELAIVHMSSPLQASQLTESYELSDVHRYSDPQCDLYRAFGLQRGGLSQVLGPRVWLRAVPALLSGYGIGAIVGDGFRMPGAFVLRNGEIVKAWRAEHAAEQLNFTEFLASSVELDEDSRKSAAVLTPLGG